MSDKKDPWGEGPGVWLGALGFKKYIRGMQWLVLCPFHKRGASSFTVTPNGEFYCFECKKEGDLEESAVEFLGGS